MISLNGIPTSTPSAYRLWLDSIFMAAHLYFLIFVVFRMNFIRPTVAKISAVMFKPVENPLFLT